MISAGESSSVLYVYHEVNDSHFGGVSFDCNSGIWAQSAFVGVFLEGLWDWSQIKDVTMVRLHFVIGSESHARKMLKTLLRLVGLAIKKKLAPEPLHLPSRRPTSHGSQRT